jgi:hypothetical protein
LYPTKETALNRLASVLAEHGKQETDSILDQIELKSQTFNDQIDETFRDGIARILGHADLPAVSRIRAVMNWTGFWLILAEMNRAAKSLKKPAPIILCDCGSTHAQLRRTSQRCLKQILGLIETAVQSHADSHSAEIPKRHLQNIRGFFWATAATIKLLNAWNGRKHFTLGLDILEALVLAGCESGSEMPYDVFLDEWIYGRCGIVIGRNAAEESDLLATLDSSIFEDNENELATQMAAAGLLTQYSDATRMVSTGGLK